MNLMPFVSQVASGRLPCVRVFGSDWETKDGSGCRDYIHVCDLAHGHLLTMKKLLSGPKGTKLVYNLGTGSYTSVWEMIDMMKQVSGVDFQTQVSDIKANLVYDKVASRRRGDVAIMYADVSMSEAELGWKANRSLRLMCQDLWRWQQMNPMGYKGDSAVVSLDKPQPQSKRRDSRLEECVNRGLS